MSTDKKAASKRLKLIRAAVLSASLLGFVPLYTQIRADQTITTDSTSSSSAQLTTPSATVTPSAGSQPSTSSRSTTPLTRPSHARTRGS